MPRSTAMKLSGHKTEAIYKRYAIVSKSDLREGTKKIAAKMKGRRRNEMKITVYPWYDPEQGVVILCWGVYQEGMIADCAREVSPGETAFGRTFEQLMTGRSFEAESSADD